MPTAATSVPAGPPQPPPANIQTSRVILKPKHPSAPKLILALPKPAPPRTIPDNILSHKRPDLSIVVLDPYEPDADEQHLQDIIDEQLQDEHPCQRYMKAFAKPLSTILRHEPNHYEQRKDPIDNE